MFVLVSSLYGSMYRRHSFIRSVIIGTKVISMQGTFRGWSLIMGGVGGEVKGRHDETQRETIITVGGMGGQKGQENPFSSTFSKKNHNYTFEYFLGTGQLLYREDYVNGIACMYLGVGRVHKKYYLNLGWGRHNMIQTLSPILIDQSHSSVSSEISLQGRGISIIPISTTRM